MALEDANVPSVGRPRSNLAPHVLEMISSRLSPADLPNFALTCKQWNSTVVHAYPADICPLLMNSPRWGSNVIRYYSPYFNKNFELDCPFDLSDAKLCSSSKGWLMLGWKDKIIIADPFTGVSHEIPMEPFLFSHFSFFWDPITSKFQIFGIRNRGYERVDIGSFDGESWSWSEYESDLPFFLCSHSNPILYRDNFYCLGSGGELGVYNMEEDTWEVLLMKPDKFSFEECYLIESEGELLSILIGKYGLPLHVIRLNEREMMWEEVERLEGRSLFSGLLTSVSILGNTILEGMKNKVFLPRFHGDAAIVRAEVKYSGGRAFFVPKMKEEIKGKDESNICWYSLEDDKFHGNYFVSKRYLHSIWINPIPVIPVIEE